MIDTPQRRRAALGFLGAGSVVIVLLGLIARREVSWLADVDRWLGEGPLELTRQNSWLLDAAEGVATATLPLYVIAAIGVLAIGLALNGHRRAAVWSVLVVVLARVAYRAGKALFERPRPEWDDPVSTVGGWSYPSGHSTVIAAASGVIIVLSAMLIRRRGLRRLAIGGGVLLSVLVGFDRLLLGVHYPSDVFAGLLLGAMITVGTLAVFDPRPASIGTAAAPLAEAVPQPHRKLAVILNPIKVDDPKGFRTMVEKLADESGWDQLWWWETTAEDTGYRMAHEAAVWGADLAIAIGGDGTIRAVCEELAGTGIPVGIVPAGTGNLLARNLDIPLYLRAAVDVALNGQDRAIDMVRVGGDDMDDANFLVMAGMGFDAAIMEGVNENFKKRVGWLAYVWSGLKALMFPAVKVEISVDGAEPTVHRARTIVIGNVGNLQGGMPLIPDAAIDDGQLDIVLLYPRRFLSWFPLAARVLTKNRRSDATITRMRGRSVVVRAAQPSPRQLDGDLINPGRELRAECVQGRLLVRVPR